MLQSPVRYIGPTVISRLQMACPTIERHALLDQDADSMGNIFLIAGNARDKLWNQPWMAGVELLLVLIIASRRAHPKRVAVQDHTFSPNTACVVLHQAGQRHWIGAV